jgi:hypothetical protein
MGLRTGLLHREPLHLTGDGGSQRIHPPRHHPRQEASPEPEFLNFKRAQESLPGNQFRQAM